MVVVSGAGGALGSAIVNEFLNNGYQVCGLYHKESETDKSKAEKYVVNLLDSEATQSVIKAIISRFKVIDALICTAGGFAMNSIENATAAALQQQYDLNFITAYNLVQPTFDAMKHQQSGRIFLIGSRQGWKPENGGQSLAYTLSKSSLFALAKILNAEKSPVVTSVVVPSTIDTEANRKSMPDADFSKWVQPSNIAEVILFYCSEQASNIRQPVIKIFGNA